ncbi:MAG: YraN family protein [Anaerolineae bacterium]|nr:YraN family protein [Anaerolineae bacterium]
MKAAVRRTARQGLGRRGEDLAASYLEAQGCRIVARNYRCPLGEADLVVRDGECLVFVEVRTRRGDQWGTPEESVTRPKQARMLQVAEHYLAEHHAWDADWRIDLVAVDLDAHGRLRRLDVLRDVARP